jgi:meso-butanediol dehydrogenase / (S,S)-butanediol dehydrogenase / diacetyl reductase
MRLEGLRVAVTGAAGGLGTALCQRLLAEGAAALLVGDRDADATTALVEDLAGRARDGQQVSGLPVDVTSPATLGAFVAQASERFGGIDVYIGNAGILSPSARIHNVAPEDFHRVLEVNLVGAFNGLQAVLPLMRGQGGGSIVFTASVAGMTAWSHASPYCVSKAALVHLTKVAAVEYAKDGIRVNCVCPGTFRTAIHDGVPESALDAIAARHPVGRLGTVEEMVGAYVYLASPESGFTTGSAVVVDGGYSC